MPRMRRLFQALLLAIAAVAAPAASSSTTSSSPLAKPFPLLAPADASRTSLVVVEEGLRVLESLQGPVAVVAVVGPYHTGKSFLLNNLVRSLEARQVGAEENEAASAVAAIVDDGSSNTTTTTFGVFEVGQSVDPSTAGIWAYHQRVQLPANSTTGEEGQEIDLLLFDTEGFAVANVSETYDAQIFAAATVLSSVLVYNSMHLIDAKELEYLDLLAHNTQLFSLKAATHAHAQTHTITTPPSATTAAVASPSFGLQDVFQLPPLVWAVQAFTVDLHEETCTSWLTRLMKGAVPTTNTNPKTGATTASASSSSSQRLGIDGLFPSVECQTLFLPATTRPALHRLASLPPSQLTPDFLTDVDSLLARILSSLQPKTHSSSSSSSSSSSTDTTTPSTPPSLPLSGAGLAALVRLIVDGLNQGQLYNVPSRWSSFSSHLRLSSIRAAVTHFESEVSLGFRNTTPPLPAPEMAALVRRVRKDATDLVPRLLVGLEKGSVREAVREVEGQVRELAYKLTRSNEGNVREYLRGEREGAVARDAVAVENYMGSALPVMTPALKEWGKEREEGLSAAFQQQLGVYKDEGKYLSEWRELQAQCRAHTEKVREANAAALSLLLSTAEATCLQVYEASLALALGPSLPPVLPSVLESFHLPALANATGQCMEGGVAGGFVNEGKYKATVVSLARAAFAQYLKVGAENSGRVDARCAEVRKGVREGVEQVLGLNKKEKKGGKEGGVGRNGTDEAGLEEAVGKAEEIQRSFVEMVMPLGSTSECQAHERMLTKEVEGLIEGAREGVAGELKAALHVPLQEICKVVVEAKCPKLHSVRRLKATVQGECGKWVQRHEVGILGATLSPRMVKRVLRRFMEEELGECQAQVTEREVESRKRWVRVGMTVLFVVLGAMLLMILGAMGKQPPMMMEEEVAGEGEREGMEVEGEGEGVGGLSSMLGLGSPAMRRRRRSSLLKLLPPYNRN